MRTLTRDGPVNVPGLSGIRLVLYGLKDEISKQQGENFQEADFTSVEE